MEGSCAAFDHNWNIVILTQGKHKIGNTYLTEAYCLNACLYYPEKTTGCEYKKSTKECWVHTKKSIMEEEKEAKMELDARYGHQNWRV